MSKIKLLYKDSKHDTSRRTMPQNTQGKILQGIVKTLFFILLLLPVPVVAQSSIDLTIGATHSFPWNVSGLKPGDSGSASIDLINNGTIDGTLYIWVDNISQTDAFGDGAALGNYLYFNVSQPLLVSTIPLPARIDAFPTAPMTGNYLVISPVRPGEMIPLTWTWEFVDTGQLQNDAQGDSLRFDILYMLVNGTPPLPTVVPRPYSGYGGSSRTFTRSGLVQTQSFMNVSPTEEITPLIIPIPNGTLVPSPEKEKRILFGPDSWFIMIIIGIVILSSILIVNSRRK
jgi:hypothetical protein